MDSDLRLIVKTTMEKEDYKDFLYKTTFFKSNYAIPFILLSSGLMAIFLSQGYQGNSVVYFFGSWIFLIVIVTLNIVYKIERKFKRKIDNDIAGLFGSMERLEFYDDFIIINSPKFSGVVTFRYDQIYRVIDQKRYFLVYFNATQSIMIRKKDMNLELNGRLRSLYKEKLSDRYDEVWY